MKTALVLAASLALGLASPGWARTFVEQRYSTKDGLPSDFVKSIARDSSGFIWLATDAGLVRYDGVQFVTFDQELSFPFVKGLLLTESGKLLAIGDSGLLQVEGSAARPEFRRLFPASDDPGDDAVVAPKGIYEDKKGRLWISEPRAIVRVEGDRLARYAFPSSSHSGGFLRSYRLAEDDNGTLWAAAQTGALFRFDEDADRFIPVDPGWPVAVLDHLRAMDGALWAATARGLYAVRPTDEGQLGDVARISEASQLSFIGRLGSDIILGTVGPTAYVGHLEDGRFVLDTSIAAFMVQHVFEDGDRGLWLSTDEGALHLRTASFEPIRPVDAQVGRLLVSFAQTEDGVLYACNRSQVYVLRQGQGAVRAVPLLEERPPFLLGLRTDGRLVWAVSETSMLELHEGRVVRRVGLSGIGTLDVQKDGRGRLWLLHASQQGVLSIGADGALREYGPADGVPAKPLALDESPHGQLFVATSDPDALLVRYDEERDTFSALDVSLDFEPGDDFNVYDVKIDGEGCYWVASSAGLIRVEGPKARLVTVGPGHASPASHAVTVGDDGIVWFATSEGVVRLDPETGAHDRFAEDSGLPSKSVAVRGLFAAPDGEMTVATARGVARLTTFGPARPDVPAPVLLDVRINEDPVAERSALEVPYGAFIESRFATPYYEGPLDYQVRVDGRDDSWRHPLRRNDAVLAGLEAGPYALQVRAVVPGSDRTSPAVVLPFTVGLPWYRSWWAFLLAAAALMGVAWAGVAARAWRSARTELQLRILVDERTEKLSEANRLLGERNAEMERFIYTVSHDLKSPLISIAGFIGLLERDLAKGRLEEIDIYVSRVKASAAQMETLLDELLEMSRVGRVREEPELVAPSPLTRKLAQEMATRIDERGAEVSIQPGIPIVYMDPSRLRQVLQNLLDNALKFLGDQRQPRIEVGGQSEDGRTRLFVRDNGVGIPREHHESVFDLFHRLQAGVDGTGVGLSLVRRIVEVQGGRVWVESDGEAGRGTTVWLELPSRQP